MNSRKLGDCVNGLKVSFNAWNSPSAGGPPLLAVRVEDRRNHEGDSVGLYRQGLFCGEETAASKGQAESGPQAMVAIFKKVNAAQVPRMGPNHSICFRGQKR